MTDLPARRGGRPPTHDEDTVERFLWEVAVNGGNVRKGHQAVLAACETDEQLMSMPAERTVRKWVSSQYADRYDQIRTLKANTLDEHVARAGITLAIRMREVEEKALDTALSGLPEASAVEASQVLRNVSQSKKLQVDAAGALRGRGAAEDALQSLVSLAKEFARAGHAQIVDSSGDEIELVDVEVVEP